MRPADVPAIAATLAASGNGSEHSYVMYSDAQRAAWVVGNAHEGVSVELSRGQSDLITVVELAEVKGLSIAPIGVCSFCLLIN